MKRPKPTGVPQPFWLSVASTFFTTEDANLTHLGRNCAFNGDYFQQAELVFTAAGQCLW